MFVSFLPKRIALPMITDWYISSIDFNYHALFSLTSRDTIGMLLLNNYLKRTIRNQK